jgi:hypothetical protein
LLFDLYLLTLSCLLGDSYYFLLAWPLPWLLTLEPPPLLEAEEELAEVELLELLPEEEEPDWVELRPLEPKIDPFKAAR